MKSRPSFFRKHLTNRRKCAAFLLNYFSKKALCYRYRPISKEAHIMVAKGVSKVRSVLKSIIQSVCVQKHAFVKNPKSDFSRERKLPLRKMLEFLLCIEGRTISSKLLNYFRCSLETASSSAFVQQRSKLNSLLFPYIFNTFVQKTDKNITYKEYRLLAADGSVLGSG